MYRDEFYIEQNGEKPAEEWLNGLNPKESQNVLSKMQILRDEGLRLINNETLRPIKPLKKNEKQDKNLYELICGSLRIGIFYGAEISTFIYLNGWRKKKQLQIPDIKRCRSLMHKYIDKKGGK